MIKLRGDSIVFTTNVIKLIQLNTSNVIKGIIKLPWREMYEKAEERGLKPIGSVSSEGIYESLEFESTLELHNSQGTKDTFKKRKNIRYLQDGIIAFQNYAWGDGEILLNYRTNLGKPVDRYRTGYKTYILISLREVKNKGDIDEFNIQ